MSTPSPDDVELLLRDLADGRGTLGDVFEKHAARTAQCIQELAAHVAALQAENEALHDDPAEQRAERYALEARDLTLRLIATEQDRDAAVALLRELVADDTFLGQFLDMQPFSDFLSAFDARQKG